MSNRSISFAIFLVALVTLLFELNLVKVFDTLWSSNLSYMLISLAMFALGLAGIVNTLFPIDVNAMGGKVLSVLAILFSATVLGTFFVINAFPFNSYELSSNFWPNVRNMFVAIAYTTIPFFLSGLILTTLFSNYSKEIQKLYFYDLVGASIGCVIIIPLLPLIAPEGLMIVAAGLSLVAAALLYQSKMTWIIAALGLITAAIPFTQEDYLSLELQTNKRGIMSYAGGTELTHWDPIARIDIIDVPRKYDTSAKFKWIAYDAGTQTSYFYNFDGDFQKIRDDVEKGDSKLHFWGDMVVASHYLKQDTDQDVLVIGSAGGQEVTAAIAYGAKSVDGVELVGKVVDLGKNEYADYIGNIFSHPNVNVQQGEGRSFLRSTDKKYDIIQIMSNHTSSSIASGSSAANPTYLQTKEAYLEYLTHLKPDGLLHINHHIYNRMLGTAAVAWKELGKTDFYRHVAVFMVPATRDNLPTFLLKMTPWTQAELEKVGSLLYPARLQVNPMVESTRPLDQRLMRGEMTKQDIENVPYQIRPTTDDHPYFNLLRKTNRDLDDDIAMLLDTSTARHLNSQRNAGIPMDVVHLFVVGAGASVFALLVFLLPLLFSQIGRERWPNKTPTLAYFSLLGLGFIIFELVSIQLFMRLIGYPLYSLTTVIFGYLIGAGFGSLASEKMGISPQSRWNIPFIGIIVSSLAMMLLHPMIIDASLQLSQAARISITLAMILPVAFFLGMAFPLGVLRASQTPYAKQAIAWAWGINGVFTVIGGFLSTVLSIFFGFKLTLLVAILCYVLAYWVFHRLSNARSY